MEAKPIVITGLTKSPTTKYEKGKDDLAVPVTTVTLVIHDVSARDLLRLGQCFINQIPLEVEITPTIEQLGFEDQDRVSVTITAENAGYLAQGLENTVDINS